MRAKRHKRHRIKNPDIGMVIAGFRFNCSNYGRIATVVKLTEKGCWVQDETKCSLESNWEICRYFQCLKCDNVTFK